MGTRKAEGVALRCRGLTRAGAPCKRPATDDGFCRQHGAGPFYARVLSPEDREAYARALAQEGLAGEVAVLRLHLLRLVERGDLERLAEIPRTVHALVRALKDDRAAAGDLLAALDSAIRDEGRRWLEEGNGPGEVGAAGGPDELDAPHGPRGPRGRAVSGRRYPQE